METDIYKTPEATLDESESNIQALYVVAPWKFSVLYLGTLGLYAFYWFYKNWKLQKLRYDLEVLPVARAIFSIFFIHQLFEEIDHQIELNKVDYSWHPSALATVYIIAAIASWVVDRFIGESGIELVLSFAPFLVMFTALYRAQSAINHAEKDPKGALNARLTAANILWLVPGLLLVAMVLLSIFAAFGISTPLNL